MIQISLRTMSKKYPRLHQLSLLYLRLAVILFYWTEGEREALARERVSWFSTQDFRFAVKTVRLSEMACKPTTPV